MFATIDDFTAAILDADPGLREDAAVMEQIRTIAGCAAPVRYEELTSDDVAAGVYLAYMVNGADHDTAARLSGVLDAAPLISVIEQRTEPYSESVYRTLTVEQNRWVLALAGYIDPERLGDLYYWLIEGDLTGATLAELVAGWADESTEGGE